MMGLSSKRRLPGVLVAAVVAASVLMGCREKTKPPTTKPAATRPAPQPATTIRANADEKRPKVTKEQIRAAEELIKESMKWGWRIEQTTAVAVPAHADALEQIFADKTRDDFTRVWAFHLLLSGRTPHGKRVILKALKDPSERIRAHGVHALPKVLSGRKLIERYVALLNDKSLWVRYNAAEALQRHPSKQHISALVKLLGDESVEVRGRVFATLWKWKMPEVPKALRRLTKSPDWRVAGTAAYALGAVWHENVDVKPIHKMLDRELDRLTGPPYAGVDQVVAIIRYLGQFDDSSSLSVLTKAATHKHGSVSAAARTAIEVRKKAAATRPTTQPAAESTSKPATQPAVGKAERARIAKAVAEAFDQVVREHARAAKQLAALKPGVPVPYKHTMPFKTWGPPNSGSPSLNRSPAMEDLAAKCLAAREKGLASHARAYVEAASKYFTHKDAAYRTVACEFLEWFPQYAVESDLTPAVGVLLTDPAAAFEGVFYGEGQLNSSYWIIRIDGGVRVSDFARRALARMTTYHFDNLEAFRSWWPRNKEYRRRLWYWSLRWRYVRPGRGQPALHEQAALADLDDFKPGEALRMLLLAGNSWAKLADCGLPPAAGLPQRKQRCPVRERSTYHPQFSPKTIADFVRKHDLKGVVIRIVRQKPIWPEARGASAMRDLFYTILPVLPLVLDKSDAALVAAEVKDPRGVLARRNQDIVAGLVKVLIRLDPKRAEGFLVAQLKREPHQPLIAEELVRQTGLKHWEMIQAACPDRADKQEVIGALAELRTPQAAAALGQWLAAEDWRTKLDDDGYETDDSFPPFLLAEFVKAAAAMNGGMPIIGRDLLDRSVWRLTKRRMTAEQMRKANKAVPAARAEVIARLKRFFARAAAQPTTQPAVAWGKAANGLQAGLRCRVVAGKRDPETVLVFHVRNTADKPLRLLRLRARKWFWGEKLPIEVKVGGKILRYRGPVLTPPPPPSVDDYIRLAPGAIDSVEGVMIPKNWGLDSPIGAEVTFVFTNTREKAPTVAPYDQKTKSWTKVEGLWTGIARSSTIKLTRGRDASGAKPATQPMWDSVMRIAEAFQRIHKRVEALKEQYPVLKGIAKAEPQFGGDTAFTRIGARWEFASNASEWGKGQTPSAVDASKPFCRISLNMWTGSKSGQPVDTQRSYQVSGVAWEGFLKVWSDDAKLIKAVKAIVAGELARVTQRGAGRNTQKMNPPPNYTGKWTVWYTNGPKRSEAQYSNGTRHGARTSWHPDGRKHIEENYKNGRQHGTSTMWYSNGQRQYTIDWENGEKHGKSVSWYPNGWKEDERVFEKGKFIRAISVTGTLTPRKWGVQRAKEDIAKGRKRIYYYGLPWSAGKPLVDDRSGLPVEILAGCTVTKALTERVEAYNETIRASVSHPAATPTGPATQPSTQQPRR